MSVGQLVKHRKLGLSDEQAVEMYRTMMRARKYDERAHMLQRSGKVVFHVSGIGQEAAQAGAAFALDKGKDYLLPYYRDYAFVLAFGMTMRDLMLALFYQGGRPEQRRAPNGGPFQRQKQKYRDGFKPCDHSSAARSRHRFGCKK